MQILVSNIKSITKPIIYCNMMVTINKSHRQHGSQYLYSPNYLTTMKHLKCITYGPVVDLGGRCYFESMHVRLVAVF